MVKFIVRLNEKGSKHELKPLSELGENIGNPSRHHRYSMIKEGQFSDFSLVCHGEVYPVHRCILFSESLYFQTLFSSDWKESPKAELILPEKEISREAFEIFLLFLYTNLIPNEYFKRFLLQLYDLSDYFQVKKLKDLVLKGIKKCLTVKTAELYLSRVGYREEHELQDTFVAFVAENFCELSQMRYPFHKMGKVMLLQVLETVAATNLIIGWRNIQDREAWSRNRVIEYNIVASKHLCDPKEKYGYSMFTERKFTDYVLVFNGQEYPVHKCILFSESGYFQKLLVSDSAKHKISSPAISQETFQSFVLFLYTGAVQEEIFKTRTLIIYWIYHFSWKWKN
jgi:hypothetical protein